MRHNVVLNVMGLITKYIGLMFIFPTLAALVLKEYSAVAPFLYAGILSVVLGYIFLIKKANQKDIDNIKKSESLAIVCFAWILFALLCSIPYLFYGFDFTNALFEAVSGVTTTGATVIDDFTIYPKSLFFFRSLTQWFGGMGIVVLFIAVLPKIAVAGRQMFYAEAPAPTQDKATPRIRYTASWLWGIYFALTLLETIVLRFLGLDWFNSIVTALSTIATGGFSAMGQSVAEFNSFKIGICVTIFMFVAGLNYILIYRSFKAKNPMPILKNEEFRAYVGITCFLAVVLALSLVINMNYNSAKAFLYSFFEVISTMTS
ncbi:TrkH family potassium uptake protein, partial [bacterium]|nr:TrkH family potassium uptake protein [bacterium]